MNTIRAALQHAGRLAIVDNAGNHRYEDVLRVAGALRGAVRSALAAPPGNEQPRVAIMCEPGHEYVAATWATWLSRGIAVPLCLSHPDEELKYVLEDSGAGAVISSAAHAARLRGLTSAPVLGFEAVGRAASGGGDARGLASLLDDAPAGSDDALMIYTSGTTGRPKGVVHRQAGVAAQAGVLADAWGCSPADRVLHALPLHHVHGIVCALLAPLLAGSCVEFLPRFSPKVVWERLRHETDPITLFMGVPTMYSFLINAQRDMAPADGAAAAAAAARVRLFVSGSAACPPAVHAAWAALSGQTPLERYGMTETGIVISNPLHGERRVGTVGTALPGLDIKLVGDDSNGTEGEIRIKGEQIFRCYWNRPETTAESFDQDGYFMTGDIARLEGEPPYYRIVGRASVDIIKSGGYKISALDIEAALLEHPDVAEVGVVGLPDNTYGEIIAAVVTPAAGAAAPRLEDLQDWLKDRVPAYWAPKVLHLVQALPRNAMGKVNKKALRKQCFPEHF